MGCGALDRRGSTFASDGGVLLGRKTVQLLRQIVSKERAGLMHLTRKHSDAECSVHEERTESTILVKFRPSGQSQTKMLMSCESSVDAAKRLADAAALKPARTGKKSPSPFSNGVRDNASCIPPLPPCRAI